jgi:hypothetical protein
MQGQELLLPRSDVKSQAMTLAAAMRSSFRVQKKSKK